MDWGIVIGLVALATAIFALWSTARVNSRVDRLSRLIDENVANISELRALIAEQRDDLDEHEEALAEIAGVAEEPSGPPVVIYNPTKSADFDYLKILLARVAADADLPSPIWVETTADDPGFGQARRALDMGASVVIAAGGDGTVRNVAEVLAGTGTPLGLLPVGTGNLLARNLSLPFTSARRMAIIALTGRDSAIDVGWLEIPDDDAARRAQVPASESGDPQQSAVASECGDADQEPANELPGEDQPEDQPANQPEDQHDGVAPAKPGRYAFLVMSGLGFDADIMAAADEESALKSKIGWLVYVKAALPHLLSAKMRARITTGRDVSPVEVEARSVMLLNCGELVGGLVLDPHAKPDDGWLELAVLDTRRGLIGWGDVARQVGLNGLGLKAVSIPGIEASGDIDVHRISSATIVAETPQLVQVDGDVIGLSTTISGCIEEGALRVRIA
ncbi:NAD(+)/NADH kinase [Trueperella pecoris]|uniref:NAD(+)/NADH kinase n=1 Tax=Trueperella pecoris TaxID=2733571 RepID=A0A7M1R0Q5_9ACTO|nr:diacylglycerol kinase family protein [Trueperella pecoris]QOR47671.1 NAD(+)/NADH kinase [Trueperella pecoris]